jgi:hypothetical protein
VDEFDEVGIVRLTGVFDEDAAAAMREPCCRDWEERYAVVRHDPTTWTAVEPWRSLPSAKRDPAFLAVLGDPLRELADELIGTGWSVAKGFGNLLASFPDAERWHLPGADALWHSDSGYARPMAPVRHLRIFAVFGDLPPGNGGTLLVAGSHRMVRRFVESQPETAARPSKHARRACHASNPWLEELTLGDGCEPGRAERFFAETDVDGIPARVIEVSGRPGDVFVCHPWTIHVRPPNAGPGPRFVRSPTLAQRD